MMTGCGQSETGNVKPKANTKIPKWVELGDRRDGLAVKGTVCSSRGPGLILSTHVNSQQYVSTLPWDSAPFPDLLGHQTPR